MKIINSPIFSVSPDIAGIYDPVTRGLASKPKAVAQAKKIARKRDRARMRPLVAKELLQEHLTDLAELAEAARQEREYAYYNFMRQISRPTLKIAPRAVKARRVEHAQTGELRLEFRIERFGTGEVSQSSLLASCAID